MSGMALLGWRIRDKDGKYRAGAKRRAKPTKIGKIWRTQQALKCHLHLRPLGPGDVVETLEMKVVGEKPCASTPAS